MHLNLPAVVAGILTLALGVESCEAVSYSFLATFSSPRTYEADVTLSSMTVATLLLVLLFSGPDQVQTHPDYLDPHLHFHHVQADYFHNYSNDNYTCPYFVSHYQDLDDRRSDRYRGSRERDLVQTQSRYDIALVLGSGCSTGQQYPVQHWLETLGVSLFSFRVLA